MQGCGLQVFENAGRKIFWRVRGFSSRVAQAVQKRAFHCFAKCGSPQPSRDKISWNKITHSTPPTQPCEKTTSLISLCWKPQAPA